MSIRPEAMEIGNPRHVFLRVSEQRIRALLFIAIAISCASCITDAQLDPIQTASNRDAAGVSDQEDCLYREVSRLVETRGSPLVSLQNVAVAAARFCSQDSLTGRVSASVRGAQKRDDQAKAEQRAFAIGLELREKGTGKGMTSN